MGLKSEEKISELEDIALETTQNEHKKEKKNPQEKLFKVSVKSRNNNKDSPEQVEGRN